MKDNELLVKIQKDFKERIGFKCSDCESEAEYLDKTTQTGMTFVENRIGTQTRVNLLLEKHVEMTAKALYNYMKK